MVDMSVSFYGVRGSTPWSSPRHMEFGTNTCCVVVEVPDEAPIILDMGSGLFGYGQECSSGIEATVLLTHLHWDHVAGLPFFGPVLCPGGKLDIFGPADCGMTLEQAIDALIKPPYFPVSLTDFAGVVAIYDFWNDDLAIGSAKVRSRPVPHTSATSGYRIEVGGSSVVYVPDHQQPIDDPTAVAESVLELCDGADLLIHDGQYPPDLFAERSHWGHSTPAYALEVARQSGVDSVMLFSHDPMHDDDQLRAIEAEAQRAGRVQGIGSVVAAREGMTVKLG